MIADTCIYTLFKTFKCKAAFSAAMPKNIQGLNLKNQVGRVNLDKLFIHFLSL